jgi:hypothetical protein
MKDHRSVCGYTHRIILSHYWLKLKDFSKWQDSFKGWCKDGKRGPEDNKDEIVPGKGGAHKDWAISHKAGNTDLRR